MPHGTFQAMLLHSCVDIDVTINFRQMVLLQLTGSLTSAWHCLIPNVHFDQGGVIGIDIRWDCDLDWNVRYCNPVYSFSRLDDPDTNIAVGFNFR